MKKIKVDWDVLCHAFEDASGEADYYLDTKTGEVIMVSELAATIEECEKIRDEIEEDSGDRYLYIERQMPWEGYQDMEDFIETVEDKDLREKLYIAINGRGAFHRFKDVLLDYPEERERWFNFHDARLEERILDWLEAAGYEVEKRDVRGEPKEI